MGDMHEIDNYGVSTQLSEEQKRKGEKPSYEIEQLERPLQPSWVGLIT